MPNFRSPLCVFAALLALSFNGQILHAQEASKLKIGFSFESMKGERWQKDRDSFEARARQLGAVMLSTDANGDDELQLRQVHDMIKADIKVLVLLPHDPKMAAQIVDAAKSANVKVISYDRLVSNSDVLHRPRRH